MPYYYSFQNRINYTIDYNTEIEAWKRSVEQSPTQLKEQVN